MTVLKQVRDASLAVLLLVGLVVHAPPAATAAVSGRGLTDSAEVGPQARATRSQLLARARSLTFDMSLASFMTVKRARKTGIDKDLVWTDDGCSGPRNPYKDDFLDACLRHDFAFRNFGSVKRLSPVEPTRLKINERFLSDMRAICARKDSASSRAACRGAAVTFAHFVNDLKNGATAFHDKDGCDAGYICLYDDDNQGGWRVQFSAAAKNLKDFAGGSLNDNVKSVWNRTDRAWTVYGDPDFKGSSSCTAAGAKNDFGSFDGVNDEVSSLQPSGCRPIRDLNEAPSLSNALIALPYPSSRSVTFSLDAADDSGTVSGLRVRATGDSDWRPWVGFLSSGTVVLPDAFGEFRVSFQVRDAEGKTSVVAVSNPVTRQPDTTPPSITGLSLGHADPASQFVTFALSASDNVAVTRMRAIVNGAPRAWNDYATSGTVVLPDGYGNFGIGFEVMDSSGNVSSTAFGGVVTRRAAVALSLVQTDNGGTVRSCGAESNPCTPVARQFRTTISSAYSPPADLLMKAWRRVNGEWVESSRSPFERSPIQGRTVITQTFTDNLLAGLWRFQTQVPITDATQFAASGYTYMRFT